MNLAGICAEYNPFHNGHLYHLNKTKEHLSCDGIVCVMSGAFTQRCAPAVFNKETRAYSAVANGADLVVELPFIFSTASAEMFAFGAVSILEAIGVKWMSFGSESGKIASLYKALEAVNDPAVDEVIKTEIKRGITFPSARANAVKAIYGEDIFNVLSLPNNILGIEYLKAIKKLNSTITPFTIARTDNGYHSGEPSGKYMGASAIRELIYTGGKYAHYVPEELHPIYLQSRTADFSYLDRAFLAKLRTVSPSDINDIFHLTEGLENRIIKYAGMACSIEELYALIKTKRYTHSKIRRAVLYSFMGITKDKVCVSPPYIRVLAINKNGAEILKNLKNTCRLPIINKGAYGYKLLDGKAKICFDLENQACILWGLCTDRLSRGDSDFKYKPIIY